MTVVDTFYVRDTRDAALRFAAVLAVDFGIPSDIAETSHGLVVVADDDKAVEFLRVESGGQ